ncbi:MAG: hypothetical protein GC191_16240 [Azospirillum sp.]|nr:hypothetical protein [Azospirillum sp.]
MARPITEFAEILAPMTPAAFFADHHRKAPLHIPGTPEKFASVLSWDGLSALLSQTGLWSSRSLEMVMDTRRLEPAEYCRPGRDRDNRDSMLAEFDLVSAWLRRGASLVCNDIDSLTPGLKAIGAALEQAIGGKAQGNLYCSWQAHQAFGSHFDTHDVFAVHLAGEKTWRIYQRHFEDPIAHPVFKTLGDDFHEAHKGPVSLEVTLKPGDLLYIPRGWYHDALATSQATFHVAFGVTSVIGLDLLAMLFERAVHDPMFRASLPRLDADDGRAVDRHVAGLGDRLAGFAREPNLIGQFKTFMDGFHYQRAAIRLPDDAVVERYRLKASGVGVSRRDGTWHIGTPRKGAPIPPGLEDQVRWMLDHPAFEGRDYEAAFPLVSAAQRRRLIDDMIGMRVIERY